MATRGKKEKEYPPMPANWMYKRGDVYMMDLNPYSGSEQGGVRPAIVVQNDDGNFYSNVLLVVPLTTQIKNTAEDDSAYHSLVSEIRIRADHKQTSEESKADTHDDWKS